jgi:predicted phosphodiesterase
MRYAIFSDVHSNLEALTTVLNFFKEKNVDECICCGDIVGYGPNPNECIELIRDIFRLNIVIGNHDAACCGLKDITWFNEYAKMAIIWTRKNLSEPNRMYLITLPKILTLPEESITITHGSPREPIDEYLLEKDQFIQNLQYFTTKICFVGHSHVPVVFMHDLFTKVNAFAKPIEGEKIKIQENFKYIINVGSVGQPRDFDPRACCAIYDTKNQEIEFFRLDYDFTKTQEKMYKYRLPFFLIERLAEGR